MPGHEVPPEWRHDPDGYVELVDRRDPPGDRRRAASPRRSTCSASRASSPPTRRGACSPTRRVTAGGSTSTPTSCATSAAPSWRPSSAPRRPRHLLHVSDAGIARPRRAAGVVAVAAARRLVLPARPLRPGAPPRRRRRARWRSPPTATRAPRTPSRCRRSWRSACLGAGLTTEEALTAATLNAAAALGRADRLGSLEPGKQADLVVLDAPSPQAPRLPLRGQPGPPRRQGRPRRRPRRPKTSRQLTVHSRQLTAPPPT